MESIGSKKVKIFGALLIATLVTGCYDGGWGGGPGWSGREVEATTAAIPTTRETSTVAMAGKKTTVCLAAMLRVTRLGT
jgi:hypothetical protein